MLPCYKSLSSILLAFSLTPLLSLHAQEVQRPPAPAQQREEQEQVKIFTEEVRLPVSVTDERGRFDPTLEKEDFVIVEDDVPQEITSARHLPANILLLLDTGSQLTLTKDLDTTRALALRLISNLRPGDKVALVQFNEKAEVLQDWTTNLEAVQNALTRKLSSGRRTRLSEAISRSAEKLREVPFGSRHVVLVTDGIESPGAKVSFEGAVRRLMAEQATVHVISYTAFTRHVVERTYPDSIVRGPGKINPPRDTTPGQDPTMPPIENRNPSYTLFKIDLDTKRRQQARDYARATLQSEQKLQALAEESGGRILLPGTKAEIVKQGEEVAREIDAQYVLTYRPKRPLASSPAGEYRRISVAMRRPGLTVRSRRGYMVPARDKGKQ